MIVRLKKIDSDGSVLTCVRDDGSTTWQRPTENHSAFFALHDLTHFAVESELTNVTGFYSLIAAGWNIEDFAKDERTLPVEAGQIELLVGQLDMERASHTDWTLDQFNQFIRTHNESRSIMSEFSIDAGQLDRIKTSRVELFQRWQDLPIGECLELSFEPATQRKELS